MANRSHLFCINEKPADNKDSRQMIGIGEYNYDIPFVYRLLVSIEAETCLSTIWEMPEKIAIVADREKSVSRLNAFIESINGYEHIDPLQETLRWFQKKHHQYPYMILEAGEIFDMSDESIASQNEALYTNLTTIGSELKSTLEKINSTTDEKAKLSLLYELGFGSWSNVLYFEPEGSVKAPPDEDTYSLTINAQELESFESMLPTLINLKTIRLSFQDATDAIISESFKRLTKLPALESLSLSGLKGYLPAEVGLLGKLKSLGLRKNTLTHLPAEIGQLKKLKDLYLNENELQTLPQEIGQLTSLESLSLHKNKLTELPAIICQLTQLQRLRFNNNNIVEIPADIGHLTNLTELFGFENNIQQIPLSIEQLKNLEILSLASNRIKILPKNIQKLTKLTGLYLGKNLITKIPAVIKNMPSLETLKIDDNPIKTSFMDKLSAALKPKN